LLEQAVSLQRDGRDNEGLIESLCATGVLEVGRGAPRLGWSSFAESVRTAQRTGSRVGLICSLEGFAQVMVAKQPDDSVRLIFSCETMRDEFGLPAWPLQKRRTAATLAQARAALSSSAYAEARAEGRRAGSADAARWADELARGNGVNGESSHGPLTPRENEVAVLLAHGLSNKQIASELAVSLGTVRSHVDHILTKLGLHSRAQVAVWAIQRGSPTTS
jgi:non-specific serine/threonine protein kinase